MIPLLVIGGLLLLLLLLSLVPLRVEAEFRQEFALELKYLFFTIPLLPSPPGEEEEPPREEGGGPAPSEQWGSAWARLRAILRREGLGGFLRSLGEFVEVLRQSSLRLLRHVKLKRFDLYLCLAGEEDAAQAAVLYGKLSGAVYAACGALFSLLPCRRRGVTVDLDYSAREHKVVFSGRLSVVPLFLLREGLAVLWKGLPFLKKFR